MKINLGDNAEFEFFEIEEVQDAERLSRDIDGVVYSWKTVGRSNWLEKGYSIVDVLGLTILPKGLPEWIDLPYDNVGG